MYVEEKYILGVCKKNMKERELGRPSCIWEDVDWIPACPSYVAALESSGTGSTNKPYILLQHLCSSVEHFWRPLSVPTCKTSTHLVNLNCIVDWNSMKQKVPSA